ncbi:hypothetical protein KY290_024998 [Solanum tuberosum]|uniref:AP2/ERF domain-containing protein n=1 Tax=Solanum tuberosum TaxID=4113 RepID=A0ABQ7USE4_SOLTU|nr:hypothetical protein KY284_025620 [Solanum tuberosum]KAH0754728.1 hypothetical protein KY290_024998 [Solanum tuberosum]
MYPGAKSKLNIMISNEDRLENGIVATVTTDVTKLRIDIGKVRICLGIFDAIEEVARAYDNAARLYCGSKAKLNLTISNDELNLELTLAQPGIK